MSVLESDTWKPPKYEIRLVLLSLLVTSAKNAKHKMLTAAIPPNTFYAQRKDQVLVWPLHVERSYMENFDEEEAGRQTVKPDDVDEIDKALDNNAGGGEDEVELSPSLVRVYADDQRGEKDEGELDEFGEEFPIVDHVLYFSLFLIMSFCY